MRIAVRTDASTHKGTGHVMRCLTLAKALRKRKSDIFFICRTEEGHLSDLIENEGFPVFRLPSAPSWSWQEDQKQTLAVLESLRRLNWLVVDHYDLDQRWERALRTAVGSILAIDDMANRPHDCDILLDQNFDNPLHLQYSQLVPRETKQLLGTRYALVREDFSVHRPRALARRMGGLRRVLLSMGGADPENDTSRALEGLENLKMMNLEIDVVIGTSNRHAPEVRKICNRMSATTLHIQTQRMAELMTEADLAINGGGSTTWERCVLGLPGLVVIQAENQARIAEAVHQVGGQKVIGWAKDLAPEDYTRAVESLTANNLLSLSKISAGLCDGNGAERVASELLNEMRDS